MIPVDTMEEYNEIDETNPETQDAFAAYLAEGSQKDREVGDSESSKKKETTEQISGGFLSRAWGCNREDQGRVHPGESLVGPTT